MVAYVSRVGKIYSKTLTSSWAQVLTKAQCRAIRGFKAKVRLVPGQAPGWFDLSFRVNPDESADVDDGTAYYSLSGAGSGDIAAPSNGLWARTRSSGTVVLEILTYD
jgi:hypothetical protein